MEASNQKKAVPLVLRKEKESAQTKWMSTPWDQGHWANRK
jgi:hypothetical protein